MTVDEVESFSRDFEHLKLEPFHILTFEALVRKLHLTVAGRLWHLVVVEAKLLDHLSAVRDLVLLGRGELWHDVMAQGRNLMLQTPSARAQDSLRELTLGLDPRSTKLRLSVTLESFNVKQFDNLVGDFHSC